MYLWRAVASEGEVVDILVQARRNTKASVRLMRRLLKTQGFVPAAVYNLFNTQRHLVSRKTNRQFRDEAMSEWRRMAAATL